jgi:hypothetical protein
VPIMNERVFSELFEDLKKHDFWCYQGDTSKVAYSHIKKKLSIRFAKINQLFPNIEFIPIGETKKVRFFEFTNPQKIHVKTFEFKVPPIEFEILYKERILHTG